MDKLKLEQKREVRKTVNKKHKGLVKVKKIIKKKKKESGKAEKHKPSNYEKGVRKFNGGRQANQFILNKKLTMGRLKPKQTQEGMFLKGLRTQYISRDSLNEANEARKNENINKIIDIGRVIAGKGLHKQKSSTKSVKSSTVVPGFCFKDEGFNRSKLKEPIKPTSIFDIDDFNLGSFSDFEKCPLSPIRFPLDLTPEMEDETIKFRGKCENKETPFEKKWESNFDLEEKFKKFTLEYDEYVGNRILPKLSGDEIENSIKSLREYFTEKIENTENIETDSQESKKTPFLNGYELLTRNIKPSITNREEEEEEDMDENVFCHEEILLPGDSLKESYSDLINFDPTDHKVVFSSKRPLTFEIENSYSPAYHTCASTSVMIENPAIRTHLNDPTDSSNDIEKVSMKKPSPRFHITTPPIKFYRRNMF